MENEVHCVVFEEDERDQRLGKRYDARRARERGELPPPVLGPRKVLDAATMQRLIDGGGHFRLRAA